MRMTVPPMRMPFLKKRNYLRQIMWDAKRCMIGRIACIIMCALPWLSQPYAQEVISQNQYGISQGLDDRIVHKTIRDQEGKFWVFTENGVQIFDGSQFQPLVKLPPEVCGNNLVDIAVLDDHALLLISSLQPQLYKLDVYTTELEDLTDFLPDAGMVTLQDQHLLFINKSGHLSSAGINDLGNPSSSTTRVKNKPIKSIYREDNNRWYILYEDRTLERCLEGQCSVVLEQADQIIGEVRNELWVRNDTIEIIQLSESGKVNTRFPNPYNRVIYHRDPAGNCLIGYSTDYRRLEKLKMYPVEGSEVIDYSGAYSARNNTIVDFYSDNYLEHVLCNTYNGLSHFHFNPWVDKDYYQSEIPLGKFGYLIGRTFYRPYDQKVYFCRERTGLMTIDENGTIDTLRNRAYEEALIEEKFFYYDEERDLLFSVNGIDSFGFQRYDFKTDRFIDIDLSYRPKSIRPYGDSLVFFGGGKEKVEPKRMQGVGRVGVYNRRTGILNEEILQVSGDVYDFYMQAPYIYLATSQGVKKYLYQDGLLRNEEQITSRNIWAKYFYPHENVLMVGTYGKGIYVMQDDKIIDHVDQESGLSHNSIGTIHYDRKRELFWVGTFNGICVLDTLLNVVQAYDVSDGLTENETNSFAFSEDHRGKYYYGTINGLSSFFPDDLLNKKRSKRLVLSNLEYYQDAGRFSLPINPGSEIELPYGVDSLSIHYSFYDYTSYNNIQDWRYAVSAESTVSSDKISYDKNVIHINPSRVGERNLILKESGSGFEEKIPLSIDIESWWEKYISVVFLSGAILLLLFLLANITRTRNKERQDLIESQLQSKINNLQLQSLRSQMNPHFIFNALGSIQYYIETKEITKANDYLSDFASLMRMILGSAKDEFISLLQELNLLKLYLHL